MDAKIAVYDTIGHTNSTEDCDSFTDDRHYARILKIYIQETLSHYCKRAYRQTNCWWSQSVPLLVCFKIILKCLVLCHITGLNIFHRL